MTPRPPPPPFYLHASLVAVHGQGLLLRGPSGAGKSAALLALLGRGHRLVADDVVEVIDRDGRPWGRAPAAIAGRLEVREVGVVAAAELFGAGAVVPAWAIDAVVDLLPALATPPPRPTAPLAPTFLGGVALPTYALTAGDSASLADRLEVIARLVSNRPEGSPYG